MTNIAHSYIRFSTVKQGAEGRDSERRQLKAAKEFCERSGLVLSDLSLADRGRSAFKSEKQIALKEFVRAVEVGKVKKGETLIVEAIDRLSRQPVLETIELVNKLVKAGIRIAVLSPVEMIHSKENYTAMTAIVIAVGAEQAHHYVSHLQRRVRSACERAREKAYEGEIIKGAAKPSWLEVVGGRFNVKPECKPVIAYMFRRIIEGCTTRGLVRELQAKYPSWSKRKNTTQTWNQAFVRNLLFDRRLLGEFQPCRTDENERKPIGELIPNYYPAVVSDKTWNQAQAALKNRSFERHAHRGLVNIFTGIVYSAHDKCTMSIMGIRRSTGKTERWLVSRKATLQIDGACRIRIDIDRLETAVLDHLAELDLSVFDHSKQSAAADLAGLTADLDRKTKRLADLQAKASGDADLDLLLPAMRKLEQERQALRDQIEVAKQRAATPLAKSLDLIRSLDRSDDENRIKLREAVKRVVKRIDLLGLKMGDHTNSGCAWLADLALVNGNHRHILIGRGRCETHLFKNRKPLAEYDAEDCIIHASILKKGIMVGHYLSV